MIYFKTDHCPKILIYFGVWKKKQHLELARDIAQKFNNDFGSEEAPVFTLPEPIIPPAAARIMSLRDGSAKMSKSDPSDLSRINLTDDADTIMQKVKKAKTDKMLTVNETQKEGFYSRKQAERDFDLSEGKRLV